jgi:hypothetical protein
MIQRNAIRSFSPLRFPALAATGDGYFNNEINLQQGSHRCSMRQRGI